MANEGRLVCQVLVNVKIYLNHTALFSPIGRVNIYTPFSVPFEALAFLLLGVRLYTAGYFCHISRASQNETAVRVMSCR